MNKLKDFFYNHNDIAIACVVVIIAALVIVTRVDILMDYPAKAAADAVAKAEAELSDPDIPVGELQDPELDPGVDIGGDDPAEGDDPVPEEPVVEVVYGDVNGDGFIDIVDAALVQQRVAGWDVALDEVAADVNGDGYIDIVDAALVQQRVAGWDVVLGPAEDQNLFNDGEIEQW